MFIRLSFLMAGILLAMASCKHSDNTETGLTRAIGEFEKSACPGGTVTRFDFQGEQVFVFADSCKYSDEGYRVTNASGAEICFLAGFIGTTHCRGSYFDSAATNPKLVYKKF